MLGHGSNEPLSQSTTSETRLCDNVWLNGADTVQIQKIMNDFERESSTMDMKEEMMSDAVDDAMEDEDEGEGEEVESDKILKEIMDEIGMGMNDAVCYHRVKHA